MFCLTIPDMACSACADTIQQAIATLDTQATIEANLETKEVQVSTHCSEAEIKQAISSAGYTPT